MEHRITRMAQVKIYLGKCFRLFVTEKKWKNFISTVIIMLIISMVTSEEMFKSYIDTKNGCFAVICACIWIGLFNSIQSICRERAIVKHEHRTGLHISSYIAAHAIYELVICAGEALIVTVMLCAKNLANLPAMGLALPAAMEIYLVLFLVTFGSDAIAMLISCIVKTENTAMTVMPFVLIVQMVMSGAVFALDGVAEKISDLTLSKWAINGLVAIANTSGNVYNGYTTPDEHVFGYVDYPSPVPPSGAEPEVGTLLGCLGIMALFTAVYLALSVLFLKRVDKDKR